MKLLSLFDLDQSIYRNYANSRIIIKCKYDQMFTRALKTTI